MKTKTDSPPIDPKTPMAPSAQRAMPAPTTQRKSSSEAHSDMASLAERAGISVRWEDAQGKLQRVPDATLRILLERLGLSCDTAAARRNSLEALTAEAPDKHLAPLITAVVGETIFLPRGAVQPGMAYRLTKEDGDIENGIIGQLSNHIASDAEHPVVSIPAIAQAGYHRLQCEDGPQTLLAVAPPRCFGVADALARHAHTDGDEQVNAAAQLPGASPMATSKRRRAQAHMASASLWGISAQVYSVRRNGDGGVGDATGLSMLAKAAAQQGCAALAISPMHAMFSADPGKFSPYAPSSRLLFNVLHSDPASAFGAAAAKTAIDALELGPALAELEKAPLIDWPRIAQTKLAILRKLFDDARLRNDSRLEACERFRKARGATVENHARFEAIQAERIRQLADADIDADSGANKPKHAREAYDWRCWPTALRDPGSKEVAAFAAAHRDDVDFHIFLQWLAADGLSSVQRDAREAGMAVGLIADLAVGCDSAGSQTWSDPASMLQGLSVGAPPDLFNQAGQAWGLTTFSPRALVKQGFAAFIDMVRGAFAHAGGIRVDHILGLRRLWLVPDGQSADKGAYLRYPLEDLLRLLALESWRHRAIVIGEDLGTVAPGFRDDLASAGLLGMRVLWFERGAANAQDMTKRADTTGKAENEHPSPTGVYDGTSFDATSSLPPPKQSDIAAITDLRDLGSLDELTDIASIISLHDEEIPAVANGDAFLPPQRWSHDAIAMTTTHDLPTIVGWWEGHDITWRYRIGQSSGGETALRRAQAERLNERAQLWRSMRAAGLLPHAAQAEPDQAPVDAILQFVAMTASPLALFPMEDLLGLEDQPNLPGSIDEHPNWRRRLPIAVDDLLGNDAYAKALQQRFQLIASTRGTHRS